MRVLATSPSTMAVVVEMVARWEQDGRHGLAAPSKSNTAEHFFQGFVCIV